MLQVQGHPGYARAGHAGVASPQPLPAPASLDRQFEIPESTGGSWTPSEPVDQEKHSENQAVLCHVALEGRLDPVPVQHIPEREPVQGSAQTGEQLAEKEHRALRPHLEAAPLQSEVANDSKHPGWLNRGEHSPQLAALQ